MSGAIVFSFETYPIGGRMDFYEKVLHFLIISKNVFGTTSNSTSA